MVKDLRNSMKDRELAFVPQERNYWKLLKRYFQPNFLCLLLYQKKTLAVAEIPLAATFPYATFTFLLFYT